MNNHNTCMNKDDFLFGTIDLKIVQHAEALRVSRLDFFKVSVSDFRTRVLEFHKVSDFNTILYPF